jgi:hypothetical protein
MSFTKFSATPNDPDPNTIKNDPRGPNKFVPGTKAKPAPTEQPGRKPGKSH